MTGSTWALLIGSLIGSLGLGTVASTVITWRRFKPQDKAAVAKTAAEARSIDVATFNQMVDRIGELSKKIEQQDEKIDSLEQTIREQGAQIAKLQQRNRDLGAAMRSAVVELLAWIKRALSVMTPDQQTNVGPPPDYQHLIAPPEKS